MLDAALILAGGRGSRLEPWPAPKALLPVRGVPILDRIIEHVAPHVRRTIVCTGYRAGDIAAHVARSTYAAVCSDGGEGASMVGRLRKAVDDHQVRGRALVLYGDELANVDVPALVAYHEERKRPLTFTAHGTTLPFGLVRVLTADDSGGTYAIDPSFPVLVNIGFAIVERGCWGVECNGDFSDFINVNNPACFEHMGKRATVNSLADLRRAEEVWG